MVLARLLKASSLGDAMDIRHVLEAYNQERLDDARAVCLLSEEGFGGERSVRFAYKAQLFVIRRLHKVLGRLAPKVRWRSVGHRSNTGYLVCMYTYIHLELRLERLVKNIRFALVCLDGCGGFVTFRAISKYVERDIEHFAALSYVDGSCMGLPGTQRLVPQVIQRRLLK